MKKFILRIAALGLVFMTTGAMAAPKEFTASLSGTEVVPPVETQAAGDATFTPSGKTVKYTIKTENLQNVTGMHIHLGKKGENGPPVAMILKGEKKGPLPLMEGFITSKDLMGKLKGKGIKALISQMGKRNAYLNIHTEAHPDGEIRGQIK